MVNMRKGERQMNYTNIDEYVENEILHVDTDGEVDTLYESARNLNWYFDASDAFHQPKGEGYKLVLHCLRKYLDFKFIRENNSFRFHEELFGNSVTVLPDGEYLGEQYVLNERSESACVADGTRADIYYLLNEADQNGIASRRCINYVNSNRLHLTAVLIQLIERIVENLERDPLKKHRDYAKVLRCAYMSPEYAELDVFSLFDVIGCTKKQYYRFRSEAITLVSKTLFGILAGENGLARLYVEDGRIKFVEAF